MANVYINLDASIPSVKLVDQSSDPVVPSGGYRQLYSKADGVYCIDDGGSVTGPFGSLGDPRFVTPGGRLALQVSRDPKYWTGGGDGKTLYYYPYVHPFLPLYDGTNWDIYDVGTSLSLSFSSATASSTYDVFAYVASGSAALEASKWNNPNYRGYPNDEYAGMYYLWLDTKDGKLTKKDDDTRLYLGTVYVASDGYIYETLTKQFVWNYYNRIHKRLYRSSTYSDAPSTTAGGDYWRADSTQKLEYVIGIEEDTVKYYLSVAGSSYGNIIGAAIEVGSSYYLGSILATLGYPNFDYGGVLVTVPGLYSYESGSPNVYFRSHHTVNGSRVNKPYRGYNLAAIKTAAYVSGGTFSSYLANIDLLT
jgi:hypothetical protein